MYAKKEEVKILVVDDEESIVDFIKMGLEAEGYKIHTAFDGVEAIQKAIDIEPQIIILDIMIPKMNGYQVCEEIRKNIKTSIIMLSAMSEIDNRVKGLNSGADDYMVKPFSFKELSARINARLRNSYSELPEVVKLGQFSIDDSAHEIIYKDSSLTLSPTEYNLLRYLLMNSGIVLSKQKILEKVWGFDFNGEDNIVEVYIRYLRDKLQDKDHKIIQTVRGFGYKVVVL